MKITIGVTAYPSRAFMTYEFNSQEELDKFLEMLRKNYPKWTWKKIKNP